jgi:hypothetical protein
MMTLTAAAPAYFGWRLERPPVSFSAPRNGRDDYPGPAITKQPHDEYLHHGDKVQSHPTSQIEIDDKLVDRQWAKTTFD